jgi:hypothetical protein
VGYLLAKWGNVSYQTRILLMLFSNAGHSVDLHKRKKYQLQLFQSQAAILSFQVPILSIYGSTALGDLERFFSFLIYAHSAELLGRRISLSQGRYVHTEKHEHRKNADIHVSSGIGTHDPSVRA